MGRKRKHVDYRQLYKDHYHIDFGSDMVVHHIDFDRSNNSIGNLMLLPNDVHARYHMAYTKMIGLEKFCDLSKELQLVQSSDIIYCLNIMGGMRDVLAEVMPWVRMKECFDMMPDGMQMFVYDTRQVITKDSVRWDERG